MNLFKKLFSKPMAEQGSILVGIIPAKELAKEYESKTIDKVEEKIFSIVLNINHKAFDKKGERHIEVIVYSADEANYIAKRFYDEGYKVDISVIKAAMGDAFKISISW